MGICQFTNDMKRNLVLQNIDTAQYVEQDLNKNGICLLASTANSAHFHPFPPKLVWIGFAIQQANPKKLPRFFFLLQKYIFKFFFRYEIFETLALTYLSRLYLFI